MSNIATTITQSRKLIELGLDPNSADMYYPYLGSGMYGDTPRIGFPIEHSGGKDIPAWSLGALVEVMRKLHAVVTLQVTKLSTWLRIKDLGFIWQKDIQTQNPMDAVYGGMLWLFEQGLIRKEDKMKPSNGISVTFLKENDGLWHSYTAYGADIGHKTGYEFMNCIGKAADVLNKKVGL